ncbi:MAG: CBS domain-containing protein [Nitrospinae bacterium]|nr:CBS domain-containing protein [Nitrospinota bacterium]
MTRKVITTSPDKTIKNAFDVMMKSRIAHLPVMEGDKLAGIVSDRDLRTLISRPAPKGAGRRTAFEMTVQEIMTSSVVTSDAGMGVVDAVKLMLRLKIGCLPVMENGKLAGIITKDDILDVFVEMLRMLQLSSSLYVELMDEIEDCTAVFSVLRKHGVGVLSYSATPAGDKHRQICHFRLNLCPVKGIVKDLKKKGVKVIEAYGADS